MDKRTLFFIVSLTATLFLVRLGFEYYNQDTHREWVQEQEVKKLKEAAVQVQEEKAKTEEKQFTPITTTSQQEYYVLENEYVQLVFSNVGGALVEINLPFKSAKDKKSVVLPIEVDRELVQKSPQNARFPLRPSKDAKGNLRQGTLGGYYPLIRRDILDRGVKPPYKVPARLYSFNVVSEYPEVAELIYVVKSFSPSEIVLEATQPHRRITKKFSLPNEDVPYIFSLDMKIEGDARGLWLTSGVPEIEWQSGASGNIIKYRISRGNSHEVLKIDLPTKSYTNTSTAPDWVCNSNGFFGLILDPKNVHEAGFRVDKVQGTEDPSRLELIDPDFARYAQEEMPGYNVLLPIKAVAGSMDIRLFSGPFSDDILDQVDAYYQKTTGASSDYIAAQTYFGWFSFISEPFAKFLFFLMKLCHNVTGSWTMSIIFVTIMLRLILYPLNTWSFRSMKAMQEVGPQIKLIQEKYKKDPTRAHAEVIALYRAKGVNPISGCLPLILQLPFLIGMFDLLKTTFQLRGAVFIPGWIDNLTAPDVLFTWKTPLPFIGNEFHLLPVILGAIMYVQQNVMSNLPKDRSTWTDQQKQQRLMGNIMTVVMTVLFYNFPSGLNIYWICSMLLGILQQWWTNRSMDRKAKEPVVEVVTEAPHRKQKQLRH